MQAPWTRTSCRAFTLTLTSLRCLVPLTPLTPLGSSLRVHVRHSSSNSRWKQRQGSDSLAREARVQGLKSRAAFKLLEMDEKYRLFKPLPPQKHGDGAAITSHPGQVVVDLGFAPGSWSQVALDRTKPNGRILGIDLLPAQPPRGVSTIQGNFLQSSVQALVKQFLIDSERRWQAQQAARKEADADDATLGSKPDMDSLDPADPAAEHGAKTDGAAAGEVFTDRLSYIDLERVASLDAGAEQSQPSRSPPLSRSAASGKRARNQVAEEGRNGDDGEKMTNPEAKKLRLVDVVLSDMSEPWPQIHGYSVRTLSNPYRRMMNTSGIPFRDHTFSMDLCYAALSFASDTLKSGGHFVCKFYQGDDDKAFEKMLKKMFAKVHREKPESSRSESRECYFVALRRKGNVALEDIKGAEQQQ
ncbi:FtsJ-like methyltransferase-domain-containing protein [Lasiosphaeria miniovina]|uniref:rRNA methyltransferase 2, mitochondrial n=1 Tax=Lasiosphaeria miniovina TaxID=1954250 RepID=A0AA40A503_9PEZI|nr:FtsJ-like methyltransferase-domain-containing protein [Lasiosphaeria miniovina]KAK0709409.1 FtsJ-like methyltransferase-domain-containing protein [Lasiosphaeria miniovina]